MTTDTLIWTAVCAADDILPNTGVCALVDGRHVAVFRVGASQYFAIDNVDPKANASVLSRGLVGNLGVLWWLRRCTSTISTCEMASVWSCPSCRCVLTRCASTAAGYWLPATELR